MRFFLLREVPFGGDGDFSKRALISRMNVELANDLGNLAQRSLSLIAKNCGGMLPEQATTTAEDRALLDTASALPAILRSHIDRQSLHDALEETWRVIRAANAYIDHQAPWALRRTDLERMGAVLRVLAETLRAIALVLQPFMPGSMARLLTQLAVPPSQRDFASLDRPMTPSMLPPPQGIFPRWVEDPEATS